MARVAAVVLCGGIAAALLASSGSAAPPPRPIPVPNTSKPAVPPKPGAPRLSAKTAWQAPPRTPVATVNGEPITVAQWVERMSLMSGRQALDSLVQEAVIRQAARKQGVKVTPAELDARVTEELKNFRERVGSEARYQEFLTQQRMTPAGLRDVMRSSLEVRLLQEKLRDKVTTAVQVTDQEITEAYEAQKALYQLPEEARVSHILVAVANPDAAAEAAAKMKAEQLQARAKGMTPAQFADLAREVSEDQDTKAKGGELSPLRKPTFLGPTFDEAVFAASPGLLPEPVRSFRGFHVVYLHEKTPARTRALEEVRPQIREQILARKRGQQFMTYMNELTHNAKQDVRLQY